MKFRPMLFSTPIVQANHAGRKNQTRRLNGLEKYNHASDDYKLCTINNNHWFTNLCIVETGMFNCPYGQPGDVLWVKETFGHEFGGGYLYKASYEHMKQVGGLQTDTWRPSIHMPVEACRSWCIIESIEVQRLHDISEADAIGEGIEVFEGGLYKLYNRISSVAKTRLATLSFESLWVSINGRESWEANPWVWVVRYRHVTKLPDDTHMLWLEYVAEIQDRRILSQQKKKG